MSEILQVMIGMFGFFLIIGIPTVLAMAIIQKIIDFILDKFF